VTDDPEAAYWDSLPIEWWRVAARRAEDSAVKNLKTALQLHDELIRLSAELERASLRAATHRRQLKSASRKAKALAMAAEGKRRKEIAHALGVGPRTVGRYLAGHDISDMSDPPI
jgi:DNA-binding NarL/FixJ family response regulator